MTVIGGWGDQLSIFHQKADRKLFNSQGKVIKSKYVIFYISPCCGSSSWGLGTPPIRALEDLCSDDRVKLGSVRPSISLPGVKDNYLRGCNRTNMSKQSPQVGIPIDDYFPSFSFKELGLGTRASLFTSWQLKLLFSDTMWGSQEIIA